MLLDAWRLAVGTLTAVPVRPPRLVDHRRAGLAMAIAPLAVLPLGAAAALISFAGREAQLPPLVIALLAIGAVVVGTRAFHLDGLSDVADGLAASYDRERALAVMKSGTSGPAGTVAVYLVLGLQTAGLAGVLTLPHAGRAAVLAGVALCLSRAALVLCCLRGVAPARPDGLGRSFAGSVAPVPAAALWLTAGLLLAAVGAWAGLPWWRGVLAAAVALLAVGLVIRRTTRRFGGVTGDVFGACIELSLAAMLVVLA